MLSDHYNATRAPYYRALDDAQHDITSFIRYALKGFVDGLRSQIDVVREQNLAVHWESFVYETFRRQPRTPARDRQRDLVLGLRKDQEVSPEDVSMLTPALARAYAKAGERMPMRDLNELEKMGLLERVGRRRFRARQEIMEVFMPPVVPDLRVDEIDPQHDEGAPVETA